SHVLRHLDHVDRPAEYSELSVYKKLVLHSSADQRDYHSTVHVLPCVFAQSGDVWFDACFRPARCGGDRSSTYDRFLDLATVALVRLSVGNPGIVLPSGQWVLDRGDHLGIDNQRRISEAMG